MPLNSPSYPSGPYRFIDREYMVITYRTDREALERMIPEPLEFVEPTVKYEFIQMPHRTGFGSYAGSAQMIPVRFRGD
jgi:acetoacetate decarboxylase